MLIEMFDSYTIFDTKWRSLKTCYVLCVIVKFQFLLIYFKAVAAGRSLKDMKKDQKPEKKGSLKKKKKDEEQVDNSLKGVDVRQLHEAYQTLMKKYCPDSKKKSGESEDVGPKDDCTVGMIAF